MPRETRSDNGRNAEHRPAPGFERVSVPVVISLDFELRWGMLGVVQGDTDRYRVQLEGVRDAVPSLLEAFRRRRVHATWATVGAIACTGWDEWAARVPQWPRYRDKRLEWRDAYRTADPSGGLHFAPDLVAAIRDTPGQELGSHSFSHLCMREPGVTEADVVADLTAMVDLFRDRWGAIPRSFVFPRNQIGYVPALAHAGLRAWRNNPRAVFWTNTLGPRPSPIERGLRLLDSIAGAERRTAPAGEQRASHFVRVNLPRPLWRRHVQRICADLVAGHPGEVLHLWWHPHNLGADPKRSVARIAELLDALQDASPGPLRTMTMAEAGPASR